MAGNLGLDHALLLPPFPPVERNSDGLFGRFLKRCFPRSAMGYLPEAVWHDPMERRRQAIDELFEVKRGIRFPEFLIHLMADWPGTGEIEPEKALVRLGDYLADVAAQPQHDFEAAVRGRIIRSEAPRLARDRSQEPQEMPAFFAELRLKQLDVLRQRIERDDYLTPRDLATKTAGPDEARALARELTRRTGELLKAWPAIREAAARLKQQGRRLTV